MKWGWESEESRLLRFMKIPPTKKLEWLEQMREFARTFLTKRRKKIWRKLREARPQAGWRIR